MIKMKNIIIIIAILGVIFLFVFTKDLFSFGVQMVYLKTSGQSEEAWCDNIRYIINNTTSDGVCGEGETPRNSIDCCGFLGCDINLYYKICEVGGTRW